MGQGYGVTDRGIVSGACEPTQFGPGASQSRPLRDSARLDRHAHPLEPKRWSRAHDDNGSLLQQQTAESSRASARDNYADLPGVEHNENVDVAVRDNAGHAGQTTRWSAVHRAEGV